MSNNILRRRSSMRNRCSSSVSPLEEGPRLLLCALLLFMLVVVRRIEGLQLDMVASRGTTSRSFTRSFTAGIGTGTTQQAQAPSSSTAAPPRLPSVFDVSSTLISQLAVGAIKRRLANDDNDVLCDVTAIDPRQLILHGMVGPVRVYGRNWASNLGLTCRAIDANVEQCYLDLGRIVSDRKLRLTTPAQGKAMIALNDVDFGNFITHPLMTAPKVRITSVLNGVQELPIQFIKDGVTIDSRTGTITFMSRLYNMNWMCTLQRSTNVSRRAVVTATPMLSSSSSSTVTVDDNKIDTISMGRHLSDTLSSFFNDMIFELDGTFLSFRDLMITDKGTSPSVMLSLNIIVNKFPSPGIEF